jgi:hypothetical protein
MAVFKTDKNLDVILNIDAVKLVPELKGITSEELKYVILVMDYVDGPFRKKPLDERKLMAKKSVYGKMTINPETPAVLIAMDGYKSLVFDIRRETIDKYHAKIRMMQKELLRDDTSLIRIKELDTSITFMQDRITKIEHELNIEEDEEVELKGKKKLSYLEIWQRNQREYGEYKKSL